MKNLQGIALLIRRVVEKMILPDQGIILKNIVESADAQIGPDMNCI
jgi:hypothetical protein